MKIYCCYSEAHKNLFENHFSPTLPGGFELTAYQLDVKGPGDFLSDDFLECIRQKIALVRESIRTNLDQTILWSDVDIRFGTDVVGDLTERATRDADTLFWFQRESRKTPEVNTGFIMMRCADETEAFFAQVEDLLSKERNLNEQAVINRLLSKGVRFRWDYLPWTYYARTQGWPPPARWALYHANATLGKDSVLQKERQFQEALWIRRHGRLGQIWSCVWRIPRKLLRVLKGEQN